MKLDQIDLMRVGHSIQLTGAVYSGDGKHFICFFPDECDEDYQIVQLQMDKDDWDRFIRQTDLMETEMIAKGADGQLTKTIIRKSQRQVDQNVSWKVFKRDNYACRYCGNESTPLTVDHLVLWEEGGPTTEENLVSACRKCNRTRGNLHYDEWLKHPYYVKVSQNIHEFRRDQNRKLAGTLNAIPRMVHKRSR
jgi:hypothetical protein